MNGTQQTAPLEHHTEVPNEADWALAGIPDGVNATGLLSDELEEYAGGLTEIQTLILACVATVIPLFLGLLLVLGVRMVWKKYKNHNTNNGYDNDGLRREDSCDAVKSSSFMQSAEELKTSESQYSVLMPDDAACCYAAADAAASLPPLLYNSPPNNRFGDTNKTNLNGSIITLTMKNNHLIVETEERVPGVYLAESTTGESAEAAADKSVDYDYDDDEFDMEAEMLRREFREASLLANGGPSAAAVLEPSSQTQVDLTADRRPTAATTVVPAAAAAAVAHQLQQPTAADHSSGGSSSVDSRVVDMAYAYGNQSEYTADDNANNKHSGGGKAVVVAAAKSSSSSAAAAVAAAKTSSSSSTAAATNAAAAATTTNNNNNNNDDEYLAEQRMLGNGADASSSSSVETSNRNNNCSPEERAAAAAPAQ